MKIGRRLGSVIAGGALAATFASGCMPAGTTTTTSLAAVGAPHGIQVGSQAEYSEMVGNAQYADTISKEFNMMTPGGVLKWNTVHPQPGTYNFGPGDRLVDFARSRGMSVRGHTLAWSQANPTWLLNGTFTPEQRAAMLDEHISTVVGRYKGKIAQWDVVNEAFAPDGSVYATPWNPIGPGTTYVDRAFIAARKADPDAKLFYNDVGNEFAGRRADAAFAMVSSMKQRGIPIDGVGFQMHTTPAIANHDQLVAQMQRYAAIGVEVAITELDVRLPVPPTESDLAAQKSVYKAVAMACRVSPNCHTFVMWGFTDRASWIPRKYPGYGAALVMDENFVKKPAYDGVVEGLT